MELIKDSDGELKILITDDDLKPKFPKELKWALQLAMMERKGYILKYVYDGKEYDYPKGELDSEGQSFIPKLPDKVKVYKHIPGEGLVKVTEFEGRSQFIDPEPEVAMKIWSLFGL